MPSFDGTAVERRCADQDVVVAVSREVADVGDAPAGTAGLASPRPYRCRTATRRCAGRIGGDVPPRSMPPSGLWFPVVRPAAETPSRQPSRVHDPRSAIAKKHRRLPPHQANKSRVGRDRRRFRPPRGERSPCVRSGRMPIVGARLRPVRRDSADKGSLLPLQFRSERPLDSTQIESWRSVIDPNRHVPLLWAQLLQPSYPIPFADMNLP